MMCVYGLYQVLLARAVKEMLRVREEILKTLPVREAHGRGTTKKEGGGREGQEES